MNQVELRKAAKELGVCQKGLSVADLKHSLKEACEKAEPEVGTSGRMNFDAMNQVGLRKAAKELRVRQKGVSVAELTDSLKEAATLLEHLRYSNDRSMELRKVAKELGAMNRMELRKVAKELGVRQKGVSVAELKDSLKEAASIKTMREHRGSPYGVGSNV